VKSEARRLVEADLGALEVSEATTVEGTTTTATTATATTTATTTTVAEATAAATTATTEASATAAATTAATTTETATASTVAVIAGSSEVETDSTASNLGAVESVKSRLGLLSGREVDVSETLEGTGLAVCGQRDTGNVAVLLEGLLDDLVGAVEREVTEEESVAGGAALVAVLVGTVEGLVGRLLAGSAEVDVEGTAVKLVSHHLLLGLSSSIGILKLDVTETLGAAGLAVADDTAAGDGTEVLELTAEPVLIDVPAQAANEEVLDTLSGGRGLLSLGLLDNGLGSLLSLALLGGSLLLIAVGRVGGVGVGVGVRVGCLVRC
jgi:hypothetical protein